MRDRHEIMHADFFVSCFVRWFLEISIAGECSWFMNDWLLVCNVYSQLCGMVYIHVSFKDVVK